MNDTDLSTIRQASLLSHTQAKTVLELGGTADLEQQRDDCIEKKNACQSIIDQCDNDMDALRKQKRQLDDAIAEINKVKREFKNLKEDLDLDAKRLNNSYWDEKKGRKVYDPHSSPPHAEN